ncbi:hypothetical protein C8A03DRAFT_42664 [Achaetomium macrosporum]|uniref:DNA/RNA-binding domain-containing protein n=1 Tax=Achaetomium macrosporum TaxID=79813 RepID=A0AAN7HDK3_9PEZI|nr:hypothetical protein C8A03DRAFT_42664 [Achaetomium macrosporum]
MDLPKKWNEHLRRASQKSKPKIECPLCGHAIQNIQSTQNPQGAHEAARANFEKHLTDCHARLLEEKTTDTERTAWIESQWLAAQRDVGNTGAQPSNQKKAIDPAHPTANPEDRRSTSSASSLKRQGSVSRGASPPKHGLDDSRAEFDRGTPQKGRLWSPDDDGTAAPRLRPYDKSNVATYQRQRPSSGSLLKPPRQSHQPPTRVPAPPPAEEEPEIIKQPETRPISQEQLVAEVKGIYAGLVMVENKCIEVDNDRSSQNDPGNKLNNDQWQALIALHRTLLHEHHDFFLASQHPSASPALRRLAAKYAMPARMWRHGIHSFLELLRHRLPASLEHMLTFIYMAYSMMALLYETVPAFEDTWIECLGDLGRYRMAIEDDDIRDREVWTSVSRHWYSRASDKAPTTGRLYHHLAILARPSALQQLYYYAKSLCVEMPFPSARESIMTLFDPIMSRTPNPQQARLPPTELHFVKAHGILFSSKQQEELEPTVEGFFKLLDNHINRSTRRWRESGYHMGISNICAVLGYGDENNPIAQALKITRSSGTESQDQPMQETSSESPSPNTTTAHNEQFSNARKLFAGTYNIVCRRFGDPNILPFLHVTLVFVHHLTFYPEALAHLVPHFPWKLTAYMLNTLVGSSSSSSSDESQALARLLEGGNQFPGWKVDNEDQENEVKTDEKGAAPPAKGPRRRPLPDDFALRGFSWVDRYFPDGWFVTDETIDDDDKYFEVPSMMEERRERVIWLGCRIAEREDGKWLRFNKETRRFAVNPAYDVELDLEMPLPATPGDSVDYGELPDAATVA